MLRQVAEGARGETLRIHRPSRTVAFGRQDAHAPGYLRAVEAARANGFEATERLAGGRAAVFHPQTIAVSWAIPDPEPRRGIEHRFEAISGIVVALLTALGVDARVGEVAGEYCPGRHSVSEAGRWKLFGVGQRIVANASHVGGVLVVDGADEIRSVLEPVYEALGVQWRPEVTGDLRGSGVGMSHDDLVSALVAEFADRHDLTETAIDDETLAIATEETDRYLSPKTAATSSHDSELSSINDM